MTATSFHLEEQYHYWYDKAIEYVFEFFEDPSDSGKAQKGFLSRLLLDPKTMLILLAYMTYQGKRLLRLVSNFGPTARMTNVTKAAFDVFTVVLTAKNQLGTNVNIKKRLKEFRDMRTPSPQPTTKLKVFLTDYRHSLMSGWAFFRIFRQLLSNKLGNYLKQWKKIISPYFLNGFRYYLQLLKPTSNTVSSGSSFC